MTPGRTLCTACLKVLSTLAYAGSSQGGQDQSDVARRASSWLHSTACWVQAVPQWCARTCLELSDASLPHPLYPDLPKSFMEVFAKPLAALGISRLKQLRQFRNFVRHGAKSLLAGPRLKPMWQIFRLAEPPKCNRIQIRLAFFRSALLKLNREVLGLFATGVSGFPITSLELTKDHDWKMRLRDRIVLGSGLDVRTGLHEVKLRGLCKTLQCWEGSKTGDAGSLAAWDPCIVSLKSRRTMIDW